MARFSSPLLCLRDSRRHRIDVFFRLLHRRLRAGVGAHHRSLPLSVLGRRGAPRLRRGLDLPRLHRHWPAGFCALDGSTVAACVSQHANHLFRRGFRIHGGARRRGVSSSFHVASISLS